MHFLLCLITLLALPSQNGKVYFLNPDSQLTITAHTPEVEVVFSIPNTYYAIGDTIRMDVEITNMADGQLFVIDPQFMGSLDVRFSSNKDNQLSVDLSGRLSGEEDVFPTLLILKESESAKYHIFSVVDTTARFDRDFYILCEVEFWKYSPELKYLSEGKTEFVSIESREDLTLLEDNTLSFYLGPMLVFLFESLEGIQLD